MSECSARTLQKAPGPQYHFDVWNWVMDKQRFIILDEGPPVNQKVSDRNHLFFQDIFIGYSVPPTGFSRTDWVQSVLLAHISE
jgi:hypothetical protein